MADPLSRRPDYGAPGPSVLGALELSSLCNVHPTEQLAPTISSLLLLCKLECKFLNCLQVIPNHA